MRFISVVAATFLAFGITGSPAAAQDVDDARTHYDAGRSYYEQLRYDDAAREFEEAYRLSGRAHLLKNVAVSHQHAEAWEPAIAAFERYLAEAPDADDRDEIEARVARLRELAASGASEDPELADADADRDLEDEHDTSREREAAGGGFPTASVVTLGVGVALGAVALITGLVAHGIYQDLDSTCVMGDCLPEQEADKDRGQTMAIVSTALTVGAGVAAALALVLLFTVDHSDADESDPDGTTVGLGAGPGEVGASMEVRF